MSPAYRRRSRSIYNLGNVARLIVDIYGPVPLGLAVTSIDETGNNPRPHTKLIDLPKPKGVKYVRQQLMDVDPALVDRQVDSALKNIANNLPIADGMGFSGYYGLNGDGRRASVKELRTWTSQCDDENLIKTAIERAKDIVMDSGALADLCWWVEREESGYARDSAAVVENAVTSMVPANV